MMTRLFEAEFRVMSAFKKVAYAEAIGPALTAHERAAANDLGSLRPLIVS
jgi:hypothetical protein